VKVLILAWGPDWLGWWGYWTTEVTCGEEGAGLWRVHAYIITHALLLLSISLTDWSENFLYKNLIIFTKYCMLHRMEHEIMLTEEEESILLQDSSNLT
jgi:hypothetical protein